MDVFFTSPKQVLSAIAHFHLSITFLITGWRRVSKAGLSSAYMAQRTFRNWTRSVLALAFLPINHIEAALDRKREEDFDKSSTTKTLRFGTCGENQRT